jgi:DNA anti-recombination protein RmuC
MAKKAAESSPDLIQQGGNIEQIRDILFGKSMKELEVRLEEFEKSLGHEVQVLRDDTKKMFNTLEAYVKEEMNSLASQIKTEAEERDDADEKIIRDLDKLTKKFSSFEKESNKTHSEIRSQILDMNKKFSDELSDSRKEILDTLRKVTNDLQYQKTDRSKLASLLTEMAIRLSDEGLSDE